MNIFTLLSAVGLSALSISAHSAQVQATPGFGAFQALPEAGEQPDPSRFYKVIFDLSGGETAGGVVDQPLKGLQRVARLANILDAGGVPADRRQIVVVLHGAATPAILTDAAWAARGRGSANPNRPLIEALILAGVDIRLCGQSMAALGVSPSEVAPGVAVDVAAMMTVVHHQQAGYAVIFD